MLFGFSCACFGTLHVPSLPGCPGPSSLVPGQCGRKGGSKLAAWVGGLDLERFGFDPPGSDVENMLPTSSCGELSCKVFFSGEGVGKSTCQQGLARFELVGNYSLPERF